MDIPQIVKVEDAEQGEMGQFYLATGKQVAMRRWEEEAGEPSRCRARNYETVGFVVEGEIRLMLSGGEVTLSAGDSWLVPAGAEHQYQVLKRTVAIEATNPPARFNQKDEPI